MHLVEGREYHGPRENVREAARRGIFELAQLYQSHDAGTGDFANSIWAAYGVTSRAGRLMDRFFMLNSFAVLALGNASGNIDLHDFGLYRRDSRDESRMSDVARRMHQTAICRSRGKRIPMPAATLAAARDYVDERINLLDQVVSEFGSCRSSATLQTVKELRNWHLIAAELR